MAETAAQPYSKWYLRYALGLLVVVYAFNFIDRQILVIIQESIKKDLGLSDAQLGLLSGFTFAIFYVSVGIPIARLADRGVRRNVIAWSVGIWSVMTAVCGVAGSYVQLLAARIGVGIGEAGASPPAHAIISDYFPPATRTRALSIYSAGIYLGILSANVLGGWLNQHIGWRMTFVAVGLPGLVIALLVRYTIREPRRGQSDPIPVEAKPAPPLAEAIRTIWSVPAFRYAALASGFNAFVNYGGGNFAISFFARSHHLSPAHIGATYGLAYGIAGMTGTFLGGAIATKVGRTDFRRYALVPATAMAIGLILRLFAYTATDSTRSMALLIPAEMLGAFFLGPTIAIGHALVVPGLRAFTSSILFFVLNLIGLGGGPLFTGLVSDYLAPRFGTESLRWALMTTSLAAIPCVVLYFLSYRVLGRDLDRAHAARD